MDVKKYSNLNLREKKLYWKENPLNGDIEIKIDGIENFMMYNENDDTVVKELYWTNFRGWEYTSLILWSNLLKINEGDIIYDVGTYSGIYSLIASKIAKNKKIFAFDIQLNTLQRLEKNCDINNISNINLVNAACTSFNGETLFYFYKEEGIISSVASLTKKEMNNLRKDVKAIKLDDFDKETNKNGSVGLIKIDVEDAELETLKGMQRILNEYKPDVLIEVNNYKNLKKVKKMFPKKYNIYDIDEDNFFIKKLGWYSKPSKYRNYLFTTKSDKAMKNAFFGDVK